MSNRSRRSNFGIPPERYGYEEAPPDLNPFQRFSKTLSRHPALAPPSMEQEGFVGPPGRSRKTVGEGAASRSGVRDHHQVSSRPGSPSSTPRTTRTPEVEGGPGSNPGARMARSIITGQRNLEAEDNARRQAAVDSRAVAARLAADPQHRQQDRDALQQQEIPSGGAGRGSAHPSQSGSARQSRSASRQESNHHSRSSSIRHSPAPGEVAAGGPGDAGAGGQPPPASGGGAGSQPPPASDDGGGGPPPPPPPPPPPGPVPEPGPMF